MPKYVVTHGSIKVGKHENGTAKVLGHGDEIELTEAEASKMNGPLDPLDTRKPAALTLASEWVKLERKKAALKAIDDEDVKPAAKPEAHPAPASHGKGGAR